MSVTKAVLEALYFGLALIGNSFSLPLLAAMILIVPLSIPALKVSGLRFGHPVLVTLLCACLFCAQLAPTLYTGNYLGDGRVLNTYYYTFVLMVAQLVLYWAGWFIRRNEHGLAPLSTFELLFMTAPLRETLSPMDADAPLPAPTQVENPEARKIAGQKFETRLKAATLALAAGMLLLGCMAYHPDRSQSYGPQNMAGGSAFRSIISGEAAQYDKAMDARDEAMNNPILTDVVLTPVEGAPASFMGDALIGDNLDYVISLYADYYNKATVSIAGTEK